MPPDDAAVNDRAAWTCYRPLVALPLAPSCRQSLISAGFTSTADLAGQDVTSITKACGLPPAAAAELDQQLSLPANLLHGARSALQLLQQQHQSLRRIITGCRQLDDLLGGGIAPGTVTEFCGVPGVGKTQVGMQLAVNALIPPEFGGLAGHTLYIDTEGAFMPHRVHDMAAAVRQRLLGSAAAAGNPQLHAAAESFTVSGVLGAIHHMRVFDHVQQLAAVNTLQVLLQQKPEVRLVVLDSVAFHFRQDWPDAAQRSRLLTGLGQALMAAAEGRQVAVVVINQVATRIVGSDAGLAAASGAAQGAHSSHGPSHQAGDTGGDAGVLVPALGDAWGAAARTRVVLYWEGAQRWAYLAKSSSRGPGRVEYVVREEGLCDATT